MNQSIRQLARRAAILVASAAAASVLVFGFMSVLPGDPAEIALGVNATPEAVAGLRAEFGTDRPLYVQYLDWAGGLLRWDFGESYVSNAAIGPQLADRLAVTTWLVGAAILVALLIAIPLGTLSALHHRRFTGLVVSGVSQLGIAVPAFVMGIALIFVFAIKLRLVPSGGWTPPTEPAKFLSQLVLPALSLGLIQGAMLTRYVRSAILEVLREDYMRTARAKGASATRTLLRHGLRNASIPVVTVLGLHLTTLLIGSVVIERVFVIPGLGSLLLDAVANRDLLLVQGVVMLLVIAALAVNFVVDVLYVLLDPRLRGSR
jgi:peptide/nickel transport system permease protein